MTAAEVSRNNSGCDIRVWSPECEHAEYATLADKYRCDVCESLELLTHEVRPAVLPYVSGDYNNLS